jgi:protein-tyrosine phosphatase
MHPYDMLSLDHGARLIFTPCPGTKEADLGSALETLQQAGAQGVITLMPAEELARFGVSALGDMCQKRGLGWFHLPIEDDCAPEQPFAEAFAAQKAQLLSLLVAGSSLVIHCRGGSGRTGFVAAILLLELGYAPERVKSLVLGLRPTSLRVAGHRAYLEQHYSVTFSD